MSLYELAFVVFLLCISKLENTQGASISNGKDAKQSSTYDRYAASRALNIAFSSRGAVAGADIAPWLEVDLRGYFTIHNITLTAGSYDGKQYVHMGNAFVEVMDKDVSLCSDVQVVWCGAVSINAAHGEKFTFTCNATFPVRFVRVTRPSTSKTYLRIGHIDVQGEETMKPYRSYYKPSKNRKVSQPFLTTSAFTAGDCGIVCHKHHSCINFSYSATAPTDENCLLTDKALSSHYVNDNSWTTYTIICM